ncbi:MAG: 50S ribosomal protein L10 [Desulfitobacterium hafniense]|nr:50S ribosomal protein L10 [Desulfitobacterium hafniense]
MANIQAKEPVVKEIKEKLSASIGAVLTDYRGLNVAEVTELRRKLREAGVEYKVVKNTLTRLAAAEIGLQDLNPYLEGPTAIAFGVNDAVAPAKIISDFAKDHNNLEIKAGILEGKVIDFAGVKALADLPSRDVLLAKVLGGMQSPMYGFAGSLQGVLRKFVYALEAVRQQKEAQA